jgi:hypothetical protein
VDGSTVGASAGVAPTVALTPWKRRASGAANALEMAQVAKANTYFDMICFGIFVNTGKMIELALTHLSSSKVKGSVSDFLIFQKIEEDPFFF